MGAPDVQLDGVLGLDPCPVAVPLAGVDRQRAALVVEVGLLRDVVHISRRAGRGAEDDGRGAGHQVGGLVGVQRERTVVGAAGKQAHAVLVEVALRSPEIRRPRVDCGSRQQARRRAVAGKIVYAVDDVVVELVGRDLGDAPWHVEEGRREPIDSRHGALGKRRGDGLGVADRVLLERDHVPARGGGLRSAVPAGLGSRRRCPGGGEPGPGEKGRQDGDEDELTRCRCVHEECGGGVLAGPRTGSGTDGFAVRRRVRHGGGSDRQAVGKGLDHGRRRVSTLQ